MPSILFVCTVNRFRSPLAEVAFRHELQIARTAGDWAVSSAGTWTEASLPAMPDAILAASEVGLELSGHRSRPVSAALLKENNLVIVMHDSHKEALRVEFPGHKDKIFLLTEAIGQVAYSIPDPYVTGESPLVVARELIRLVQSGWQQIAELAQRLEQKSI